MGIIFPGRAGSGPASSWDVSASQFSTVSTRRPSPTGQTDPLRCPQGTLPCHQQVFSARHQLCLTSGCKSSVPVPFLRALLHSTAHPPHQQKPRNTECFASELSAHAWHQRDASSVFPLSPQEVDTQRTFARKRPVIGFAGGTSSEIDALRATVYLPWVCALLSREPVPLIAHSSHWECHCGDGGAVRAVSQQLWGQVCHLQGTRLPSWLGHTAMRSWVTLLLLHTSLLSVSVPGHEAFRGKATWQCEFASRGWCA